MQLSYCCKYAKFRFSHPSSATYYLVDVSYDKDSHGYRARKWCFIHDGKPDSCWRSGGLFKDPALFEMMKQLPNALRSLK